MARLPRGVLLGARGVVRGGERGGRARGAEAVGHSDFQLNIQPPDETAQDMQESLDAVMQLESSKQAASMEHFAHEKQLMLNAAKTSIRNIVATAFEPLFAKTNAA